MGVFQKLFGALGGNSADSRSSRDNDTVRRLTEEVQIAYGHLSDARAALMELVSAQLSIEKNHVKPRRSALLRYEQETLEALRQGQSQKAAQLAQVMAGLENELAANQQVLDGYTSSINQIKQSIRYTERDILTMEREIQVVRALDSVNKAGEATQRLQGAQGKEYASDALARIRERQQQKTDEREAALQVHQGSGDSELQAKLKSAGLIKADASAEQILQRLKVEQALSNERVRWVKNNKY